MYYYYIMSVILKEVLRSTDEIDFRFQIWKIFLKEDDQYCSYITSTYAD